MEKQEFAVFTIFFFKSLKVENKVKTRKNFFKNSSKSITTDNQNYTVVHRKEPERKKLPFQTLKNIFYIARTYPLMTIKLDPCWYIDKFYVGCIV